MSVPDDAHICKNMMKSRIALHSLFGPQPFKLRNAALVVELPHHMCKQGIAVVRNSGPNTSSTTVRSNSESRC